MVQDAVDRLGNWWVGAFSSFGSSLMESAQEFNFLVGAWAASLRFLKNGLAVMKPFHSPVTSMGCQ